MGIRRIFGALMLGYMAGTGVLAGAESFLMVEAHSGRIVGRQDERKRRPVASLTKVATAILVLDWAKLTSNDLGQSAVVPFSADALGGSNPMGLRAGDQITLRNAIYSALLGSDNVAAQTLAHHVGTSILRARGEEGDPVRAFVVEMNRLAKGLGMKRTKFANPHGMDNARERGLSTAEDMARLCIYATRDSGFRFYVKQKTRKIEVVKGGEKQSFVVNNTNHLLGYGDINGVKTGMTALAGECLVVSSERTTLVRKLPDGRSQLTPRRLISVVLGSPDRFGQTKALVRQGWENYDRWTAAGKPVKNQASELLLVPDPR